MVTHVQFTIFIITLHFQLSQIYQIKSNMQFIYIF